MPVAAGEQDQVIRSHAGCRPLGEDPAEALVTDVSLTALRVFRTAAEQGTFTAAAESPGYTRSAVSRQIASIERVDGADPEPWVTTTATAHLR